jgi:hypothetical protein
LNDNGNDGIMLSLLKFFWGDVLVMQRKKKEKRKGLLW